MSIRTEPWTQGIPCWVDLAAADVASASAFYGAVLAWSASGSDAGDDGHVMVEADGVTVAGISPLHDGVAAGWTVYLATDDVDASTAAATSLGGSVVLPPGDVGASGRRGILADPQGAAFGLWQAGAMIGSRRVNEPGGLCWEELRSPSPSASRAFYGALFGYAYDPQPALGVDYETFRLSGDRVPLGAIAGTAAADGTPLRWLPFFGVVDAHDTCTLAEQHGGSVVMADFDTPEGRFAQLADPQGTHFWVVTSTGEAQPDRST